MLKYKLQIDWKNMYMYVCGFVYELCVYMYEYI